MIIEQNGRGFIQGKFQDSNQQNCSIQESSRADVSSLWLGVDESRMHLTQEQVSELLPLLECFVKTGQLPQE